MAFFLYSPDIMIMAGNGTSPVVGELKTSWLPTHDLVAIVRSFELGDDENSFRQILGKVWTYKTL